MSLLEIVAEASRDPEVCNASFPVVLDAGEVFQKLRPERPEDDSATPIKRMTGWRVSDPAHATAELVKSLRQLSKKTKALPAESTSRMKEILDGLSPKKLDSLLPGGEAAYLVAQLCVKYKKWKKLEAYISSGFIGRCDRFDLVGELAKNKKAGLLCLCVRRVSDLRSSQLLEILKYFLMPTKESLSGMALVREEWKEQGLSAMDKATDQEISPRLRELARDCSVLVMMAHDGFSSNELCLHHFFSSHHVEGLVMSDAIAGLNGIELFRLIRYFRKWFEKFERFPEATPCRNAVRELGLQAPEWVPSLDSVARGFSTVLDQHFRSLILNPQFQEEMLAVKEIVSSMASMASTCRYLSNVLRKLPSS